MGAFVELQGTIEDAAGVRIFELRILDPVADLKTPHHDYFCRIHCPALLHNDFDVYGVDGDQAKDLALQYIRARLKGAVVRNKQGRVVNI